MSPSNGTARVVLHAPKPEPEYEVHFVDAANTMREPVAWLVPGVIALGAITLITGAGGTGKSTAYRSMGASLSRGRPACGLTYDPPPPCDVILFANEDVIKSVALPQLDAEDADCSRIHFVERADLDRQEVLLTLDHLGVLDAALRKKPGTKMIVFDSMVSYLGDADSVKLSETRRALNTAARFAAEREIAFVLIHQNRKGGGDRAADQVSGSHGITDTARMAFMAGKHPDGEQRVLMPVKENLPGAIKESLPFAKRHLLPHEKEEATRDRPYKDGMINFDALQRTEWGKPVMLEEAEVFSLAGSARIGSAAKARSENSNQSADCLEWMRERIGETHHWPVKLIELGADESGFTEREIKRAKVKLHDEGFRCAPSGFAQPWIIGFGDPNKFPAGQTDAVSSRARVDPGETGNTGETVNTGKTGPRPDLLTACDYSKDEIPDPDTEGL